jgi:hypothetical protein
VDFEQWLGQVDPRRPINYAFVRDYKEVVKAIWKQTITNTVKVHTCYFTKVSNFSSMPELATTSCFQLARYMHTHTYTQITPSKLQKPRLLFENVQQQPSTHKTFLLAPKTSSNNLHT